MASCQGRFAREAIIRRREHGGGVSIIDDEEREEADEAVRDLEGDAVVEVMTALVALCRRKFVV